MAHLISSVYLSISFAKIGLKCTDRPQMYRISLKCTESASNVQNQPQMYCLKCTDWPQMYRIGLKCTVPQMYRIWTADDVITNSYVLKYAFCN